MERRGRRAYCFDAVVICFPAADFSDDGRGAEEVEDSDVAYTKEDAVDSEEMAMEDEKGVRHHTLQQRAQGAIRKSIASVVWV
jgi:hypothetical protein